MIDPERFPHAKATFLGALPKIMGIYQKWKKALDENMSASAAGFGSRPHTKKEWEDMEHTRSEMNKHNEELCRLLWGLACTATVGLPINHRRGTHG